VTELTGNRAGVEVAGQVDGADNELAFFDGGLKDQPEAPVGELVVDYLDDGAMVGG